MYCSKCGRQIEDGSRFCPYCGALQTVPDNAIKEEEKTVTEETAETIEERLPEDTAVTETIESIQEGANENAGVAVQQTVEQPPMKKNNTTLIVIIAVAAVAVIGLILFFNNGGAGNTNPATPTTVSNNTTTVEEPVESVKTAQHDNTNDTPSNSWSTPIFSVKITADNIKIRNYPSAETGTRVGKVSKGQTYQVYETRYNEGYTWYCIGENQWIADKDGKWVKIID